MVGERSSDDRDVVSVFSILIVGTTGAIVTFDDVDKDGDGDDDEFMDCDVDVDEEEEVVDDEVELVDSLRDTELLLVLLLLLFAFLLLE